MLAAGKLDDRLSLAALLCELNLMLCSGVVMSNAPPAASSASTAKLRNIRSAWPMLQLGGASMRQRLESTMSF